MESSQVLVSSSWDRLAALLLERLSEEDLDPLQPQTVAVPGGAWGRWIRDRIATETGVAANVRFLRMEDALLEAGAIDPAEVLTPSRALPAYLAELPAMAADPRGLVLRSYLARDGEGVLGAHAVGLAVALVNEQARAERHRAEKGGHAVPPGFQQELSRRVHARLGTRPLGALVRERSSATPPPLPPRAMSVMHLFGLPPLDPVLARLLSAPYPGRTVIAYLWTPSSPHASALLSRWGAKPDLATRPRREAALALRETAVHPLLGANGRATDRALLAACWAGVTIELDPVTEPARRHADTALGVLQTAVRENRWAKEPSDPARTEPRPRLHPDDDSLRIHASHGPVRQAEVLRDALLALFATHPDLSPRDVRILTPDVAAFAPLLAAAFAGAQGRGATGEGAPTLPLAIAPHDSGVRCALPEALLAIVAFGAGARLTASAVLAWLGQPCVRARFGLSPNDLDDVKGWVRAAKIRWGEDGRSRALAMGALDGETALASDDANTWEHGLDRLALAVCCPPEAGFFEGRLPADDIEGEDVVTLGRFLAAVRALRAHLEIFRRPADLSTWIERATNALEDLLAADDVAATLGVRAALASLRGGAPDRSHGNDAALSEDDAPLLSCAAFHALLEHTLAVAPARSPGTSADHATVGPLSSAHALPARVVALLGLDEDAFPRRSTSSSLDLLAASPRLLDPERRDDDRGAFLQAILGASDHLLVVAGLRHATTNAPLPFAAPLDELLDVLDASFSTSSRTPRDLVVRDHPLQPFGESAFLSEPPADPLSRDPRALSVALALRGPRAPLPGIFDEPGQPLGTILPEEEEDEVSLDELDAFFRDPGRMLLWQRLGTRLGLGPSAVDDREPIEPSALERWQLRDAFCRLTLEQGVPAARRILRAQGALPLGGAGEALLDEMDRDFTALEAAHGALIASLRRREAVSVVFGADLGILPRITGVVPGASDEVGVVCLSLAVPDKPQTLLGAYLRLLSLCASGNPACAAVSLGIKKGKPEAVTLLPPDNPLATLAGYVALYREGQRGAVRYAARTSHAFAASIRGSGYAGPFRDAPEAALAQAVDAAKTCWEASYVGRGEREVPSLWATFRGAPPWEDPSGKLSPAFLRWSEAVWSPVIAAVSGAPS